MSQISASNDAEKWDTTAHRPDLQEPRRFPPRGAFAILRRVTTLSTIKSYIDAGYTITAHHSVTGDNPCSHYSDLDLVALAERLGPDFDIVDNHDWFVSKLVCAKCKRKGSMSITISPPRKG